MIRNRIMPLRLDNVHSQTQVLCQMGEKVLTADRELSVCNRHRRSRLELSDSFKLALLNLGRNAVSTSGTIPCCAFEGRNLTRVLLPDDRVLNRLCACLPGLGTTGSFEPGCSTYDRRQPVFSHRLSLRRPGDFQVMTSRLLGLTEFADAIIGIV